jgi:ribosomal protein L37E
MGEYIRTGELCPKCKKGHLYPSGEVQLEDGRIERHYKCDLCGHECKHIDRKLNDALGFKDSSKKRKLGSK